MTRGERIKQEVEKTLSCIDNIKNIDANPFLFTRIKAWSETAVSEKTILIERPKLLRSAVFIILLCINVLSVIYFLNSAGTSESHNENYISLFSKEYSLATNFNYIKDFNIED